MTPEQAAELILKLTNIETISQDIGMKLTNIDTMLQATAGAIYILIGVLIACAIAIMFGGWLRDV